MVSGWCHTTGKSSINGNDYSIAFPSLSWGSEEIPRPNEFHFTLLQTNRSLSMDRLFDFVADVKNSDIALRQPKHEVERHINFGIDQCRGRFIKDQNFVVHRACFNNLDELLYNPEFTTNARGSIVIGQLLSNRMQ